MEIQIAIWTPDETHSSVRSWQLILMIIIMTTLMTTSSSVEPCEAASHATPSRILLIGEGTRNVSRRTSARKGILPTRESAGGGGAVPTECGSCLWRVCRP